MIGEEPAGLKGVVRTIEEAAGVRTVSRVTQGLASRRGGLQGNIQEKAIG
jgi:hypothetical protein